MSSQGRSQKKMRMNEVRQGARVQEFTWQCQNRLGATQRFFLLVANHASITQSFGESLSLRVIAGSRVEGVSLPQLSCCRDVSQLASEVVLWRFCTGENSMGKVCADKSTRLLVAVAIFIGTGCASTATTTTCSTVLPAALTASERARAFNGRGLALVEAGDFDGAEEAFRSAVAAEMGYAAAHNNLGLVLLEHGKLYEAALEFKYANRIDPSAVEPVTNLARLFGSIGWHATSENEHIRAAETGGKSHRRAASRMLPDSVNEN